jgi:antitoxin Phd
VRVASALKRQARGSVSARVQSLASAVFRATGHSPCQEARVADSYSISAAKDQLCRLVYDVESIGAIELTRRGRPVAVLLSVREYRRLLANRSWFWADVAGFRRAHGLDEAGVEPGDWLGEERAQHEPRGFEWS